MTTSNAEQTARALNISVRHLQRLAAQGVVPKAERGVYDVGRCLLAYIRCLQKALEAPDGEEAAGAPATALMRARTQQAMERTRTLRRALLERERQLIEPAAFAPRLLQVRGIVRRGLQEVPRRLPQLDAAVRAELTAELEEINRRFGAAIEALLKPRRAKH